MWSLNVNEDQKLLILKLSGTLTLNELSGFLVEVYDKNDGKFAAFDRFVDLSTLEKVDIDIDTVSACIHEYRRRIKPDHVVKISLFIPQKYIQGFSYLYKSMLSDDLFKLEILESLDQCADYLSVDKQILQDDDKS
jgi:hypothetical protein